MIVGIGVCSGLAGVRMGLFASQSSSSLEMSRHFADAIRQLSLNTAAYATLDDMNGLDLCPPVNRDNNPMPGFSDWRQKVSVIDIDPDTLAPPAAEIDGDYFVQIIVEIERGGQVIGEYRWLTPHR